MRRHLRGRSQILFSISESQERLAKACESLILTPLNREFGACHADSSAQLALPVGPIWPAGETRLVQFPVHLAHFHDNDWHLWRRSGRARAYDAGTQAGSGLFGTARAQHGEPWGARARTAGSPEGTLDLCRRNQDRSNSIQIIQCLKNCS